MSRPDPRGIAIAELCEQRRNPVSWWDAKDRRSQCAELIHPNGSICVVPHSAPFLLTASMSIGIMHAQSEALATRLRRAS